MQWGGAGAGAGAFSRIAKHGQGTGRGRGRDAGPGKDRGKGRGRGWANLNLVNYTLIQAGQGRAQNRGIRAELDANSRKSANEASEVRLIRANLQMTGRGSSPRRLVMSEPRPLPDPLGQPVDVLYRFQASSHGQKSSPPSLFADLSELASNSQDSDLGATQPAPAPGLALHPSDLGLPKPSPAVQFCLFSAAPTLHLPQPSARPPAPHASSACLFHGRADRTLHRGSMRYLFNLFLCPHI